MTQDPSPSGPMPTVYERIGPEPLAALATELYRGIEHDPSIRAMFSGDLSATGEAVRDMREFLTQFFGGPGAYSERKGHPRLRARHMRFSITPTARDAWLGHALRALEFVGSRYAIDPATTAEIRAYLEHASAFMVNHSD